MFSLFGLILSIVVGGLAGWIAGLIMKKSNSFLMNIILGIVGGFVGKIVLGLIGFGATSLLGSLISAVIGACILIAVVNMIKKK